MQSLAPILSEIAMKTSKGERKSPFFPSTKPTNHKYYQHSKISLKMPKIGALISGGNNSCLIGLGPLRRRELKSGIVSLVFTYSI